MKRGLFIIILLASCTQKKGDSDSPLGHLINFEKTGLRESVDSATLKFDHGYGFDIKSDSLEKLFERIRTLDKFDASSYNLYYDTCNKSTARIWKCKTSKCVTTVLVKRDYDWNQNDIQVRLTEYELFRLEKPKYINLKFINDNELHELTVHDKSLNILKEAILQDIEVGFNEFTRQKNKCTDSLTVSKAIKELGEQLK
jgi:hypothetical protein